MMLQPVTLAEFKSNYSTVDGLLDANFVTHVNNNKLLPEVKENWIKALRDPNRKQGKAYLETLIKGERYQCCFGVLCEISGLPTHSSVGYKNDETTIYYTFPNGKAGSRVIPGSWGTTLGFSGYSDVSRGQSEIVGEFVITFTVEGTTFFELLSLVELNDGEFTFPQIADIIEYFF